MKIFLITLSFLFSLQTFAETAESNLFPASVHFTGVLTIKDKSTQVAVDLKLKKQKPTLAKYKGVLTYSNGRKDKVYIDIDLANNTTKGNIFNGYEYILISGPALSLTADTTSSFAARAYRERPDICRPRPHGGSDCHSRPARFIGAGTLDLTAE